MKGWVWLLVVSGWLLAVAAGHAQSLKTKPEAAKQTIAIEVRDSRGRYYDGYGSYSYYDDSTYDVYNGRSTILAELVRSRVIAAFAKDPNYSVVDWQGLPAVEGMKDRMHRSGQFDPETVPPVVRQIGVRRLVRVEITFYSLKSIVSVGRNSLAGLGLEARLTNVTEVLKGNAWITDVKTGLIQAPVTIEARQGSMLAALRFPQGHRRFGFSSGSADVAIQTFSAGGAVDKFGDRVAALIRDVDAGAQEYVPRLLVAGVDPKDSTLVYLNQPRPIGQRFVAASGERIVDPDFGHVIGHTGETIIQVVETRSQISVARVVSGRPPVVGTELQPYTGPLRLETQVNGGSDVSEPTHPPVKEEKPPAKRTITLNIPGGRVKVGDKGVIFDDANNNERYDYGEKVYSDVRVTEVKGDAVTIEFLNESFTPHGGEGLWIWN